MRISAKGDYAVLAMTHLAGQPGPVPAARIAETAHIPAKFLEAILVDLRNAGLLVASRGPEGGYRLARPAGEVSVADVIRAVEGPLAEVHGSRPEQVDYGEEGLVVRDLWVALRAAIRSVLEPVTLADLASGTLPAHVRELLDVDDAWHSR